MIVGERRMVEVKYRRHTPEQVVRKLREADRMLGKGADLDLSLDAPIGNGRTSRSA
jgi:hypothetical protein